MNINFVFLDGKTFTVTIEKEKVQPLVSSFLEKEVFWDQGQGIWLSLRHVRYITIDPTVTPRPTDDIQAT